MTSKAAVTMLAGLASMATGASAQLYAVTVDNTSGAVYSIDPVPMTLAQPAALRWRPLSVIVVPPATGPEVGCSRCR